MTHQQRMCCTGPRGYWTCCWRVASTSRPIVLAFVLEEDILSTCCDKDDVMW